MSVVRADAPETSELHRRILKDAQETVRSLYAASRGKTGDPKCSEAVSAWVRRKATPETHKQLAKCRAMARTGGQAAKLRSAGQEAKAQHLEHRVASGGPLGVAERRAKAKALVAERAAKAKPAVVEPKVETHQDPEWKDNPYFEQGRRYREMADAVYEDRRPMRSGADRTDAVRHSMVAKAFGRLGQGEDVESVIGKLRGEWNEFAEQKKKQIEAAPKIRRGPSSGGSVIGYEHADPGAINSDEIFIRSVARRVGPIGVKPTENPPEPQKPAESHKAPAIPSIDEMLGRRSEAQLEARQQVQKAADAKRLSDLEEHKRKNDALTAQSEAAERRGIKPHERGSRIRAAQSVKKLPHGERAAKLASIQENMGSAESLHGRKQKPLPERLAAIRARKSPEVSGAMATIKAAGTKAKFGSYEDPYLKRAEENLLESSTRPGEYQDKSGIAPSIYKGRAEAVKAIAAAHQREDERQERIRKQRQEEQDREAKKVRGRKVIGKHVESGKIPAQEKYRAAAMKAAAEGSKGFKKGTVSITSGSGKVDLPAHLKGGLAVHETYNPHGVKGPKTYRVTHVGTGLGIGGQIASLGRAKEIAHAIHRRGIDVGQVKEHLNSKDPVQREIADKHLKFIKSLFGRTG